MLSHRGFIRLFYLDCFWARPYPHKASVTNCSCEVGVLRKKTIARENRLRIFLFGYLDYGIAVGIRGGIRSWQQFCHIGLGHVQRCDVGSCVDRDSLDANCFRCSDNSHLGLMSGNVVQGWGISSNLILSYRDLATIGDK